MVYKIRVALGPGKLNSDRLEVLSVPRAVDHIPIKRRIADRLPMDLHMPVIADSVHILRCR
jgi:hypothetical protein